MLKEAPSLNTNVKDNIAVVFAWVAVQADGNDLSRGMMSNSYNR